MPRHVPTLTVAQEVFLAGLNNERFSLENAVSMYENRVAPGAVGAVVHTYINDAAYEIEVLRSDGSTVAVNRVSAVGLRPKQEQR
jgi:hypothetical protein